MPSVNMGQQCVCVRIYTPDLPIQSATLDLSIKQAEQTRKFVTLEAVGE